MSPVPLPTRVGIAGAGTMGAGMAAVFARAGCEVTLTARREASLADARRRCEAIIGETASSITTTTSVEEAARGRRPRCRDDRRGGRAEAASTGARGARHRGRIDPRHEYVVALPLATLALPLERPERFAGLHWFNPPELVELVEVVGTEQPIRSSSRRCETG